METSNKVTAIILSGGNGFRLKNSVPKQFLEINGTSLFIHSLQTYQSLEEVHEIILIINEKYISNYEKILKKNYFGKLKQIVPGNKLRHLSIQNGLDHIKHNGLVVIQNGVNPTTPSFTIQQCISASWQYGVATAYIPAFHTVFEYSNGGIDIVLNRSKIGYTCDPLAARVDILKAALNSAENDIDNDLAPLDLIKKLGHPIKLILSDEKNVKVTTELDLCTMKTILSNTKENSY